MDKNQTNQKKQNKKQGKKSRTGLKIFIIAGLIGIVAASAWIVSTWSAAQDEKVGQTDAELISQGAGSIDVPEVNVPVARENASENYHVVSCIGNAPGSKDDCFKRFDEAIEAGTMYIELGQVKASDGALLAGNDTFDISDVFAKYGKTVGYIVEIEDNDALETLGSVLESSGMAEAVSIESYDADILKSLEESYPDMTKIYLCRTTDDRSRGLGLECADVICITKEYMNEYGLNAVHSAGKKFAIRTIETGMHITDAINLGVDMYYTENTARALELEKQYRGD